MRSFGTLLYGTFFILILPVFRAQNHLAHCDQQKQVLTLLRKVHFNPPDFDKAARKDVIALFAKAADEKNIFFFSSDVSRLNNLQVAGDEYYCEAVRQSFEICLNRVRELDSIAADLGRSPLALDGSDTINFVFHKKERYYCHSVGELHKRIEKRIKYDVLQALHRSSMLSPPSAVREEAASRNFDMAKKRALNKFRKSYQDFRDTTSLYQHLADCMSDAIAHRCDPHSSYLNTTELTRYKRALSTHEDSFGFSITENKAGELIITDFVPGGPAWQNELLEEGDLLIAVGRDSSSIFMISDLGTHELNELLEDPATHNVQLRVLKKDKQFLIVSLERQKIESVSNALSSFVIRYKGKPMGYIPIPSFYLDQDNESHNGCANDVAKEIIKLQKDSVQGIMLDLRFNGGGSMREAIALAGIFIDEGPVAIYRQRDEKPFLLKDLHRGTVWDGPLLVIINAASASASEFVASALQDYHRAVIAGTESFGKGTAQNLMPADTSALHDNIQDISRTGVLKITAGKFYRVTGRSHQGHGIIPDIEIPGILDKVIEKESAYPYFISCDSLGAPAEFKQLPPLPVQQLVARSNTRLSTGSWPAIKQLGDSLRAEADRVEKVPLTMQGYKNYHSRQDALNKRIEKLVTGTAPDIVIRPNSSNEQVSTVSSFLERSTKKTITQLSKDITFQESVRVMGDLIELQHAK